MIDLNGKPKQEAIKLVEKFGTVACVRIHLNELIDVLDAVFDEEEPFGYSPSFKRLEFYEKVKRQLGRI